MPGSGESDNLDERIAAAFNNGVNSTDVETLIKAAEAASVSANERAERARARALVAAVVAVGVVAEYEGTAGPQPPLAVGLVIGVAAAIVTTWRARAVPVAITVVVLCVAYHLLGFPGLAPAVALYPVLYTLAATGSGLRSIALAVAAIPEGLPIVATLVLARGMWRMARQNALIERLSAEDRLRGAPA
jgi:hypothetical protein